MYNKKVLIDSIKKLGSVKSPPKKKDMIIDSRGQWAHPGQNTRIPSNNITMDAVPYPVYGDPNVGPSRMMYPEQEYNFPGADYVDEYPQMNSKPLLKNKYGGELPKFQDAGTVSKGLSKGLDLLSKVTRSNYNPLVIPIKKIGYKIASQHAMYDRSKQEILKALSGKSSSGYFGNTKFFSQDYGPGKRDLNKLYFFGDETGFLPVNYDFSSDPGLDAMVEKYGPLKAFLLNSEVGHGEPISAFQLNTADILRNEGIDGKQGFYEPLLNFRFPKIGGYGPEVTPQFYLPDGKLNLDLLGNSDIRYNDVAKIMESINHPELQTHVGYLKDLARAKFNTLFDEAGTDVIPFQVNASGKARPKFLLETNPVGPLDNIAGHMAFLKRLPNKELELTSRDFWGFSPAYDEKWAMNTAFQKAQRKAMEMFGKPFVLTQTNPIKFRKGGDSTNDNVSVKEYNFPGADYIDKYPQMKSNKLAKKQLGGGPTRFIGMASRMMGLVPAVTHISNFIKPIPEWKNSLNSLLSLEGALPSMQPIMQKMSKIDPDRIVDYYKGVNQIPMADLQNLSNTTGGNSLIQYGDEPFQGESLYHAEPKDYTNAFSIENWKKQATIDAYNSIDATLANHPPYGKDIFKGIGDFNFAAGTDGWEVRNDLSNLASFGIEPFGRQWVPGKNDFFTNSELKKLITQQIQWQRSRNIFNIMYPEGTRNFNLMKPSDTGRDELFSHLFPDAALPNFRSKILQPEQESFLRTLNFKNPSMGQKGKLSSINLSTAGRADASLPKTFTDLQESLNKNNLFTSTPAKELVTYNRDELGLSLEDITKLKPEEFEILKQKLINLNIKRSRDWWKNDNSTPFTVQDAWKEISKIPGFKNQYGGSSKGLSVKESNIQGKGLFINKPMKKGETIGIAHINDQATPIVGKYHNHSEDNPTAINVSKGNKRYLVAASDLPAGTEVTTNYRLQPELEQPEDFMKKGGMTPQKDGYRTYSPFKKLPYIDVETDTIDSNNIVYDLNLQADNGLTKFVRKNTGLHTLPGAKVIREIPINRKGGSAPRLPRKKNSRGYSKSLEATNKLFAENSFFAKPRSRKNKIYDPNAKYYQDGGISKLEGDLISKVIMNRNRGVDFVDRAFALGENPGTPMFNLPDDEQFGQNMSHKMAWGDDDNGQAWMYPTIMNPNDEAIQVPNQYADYISSEGYKNATGMNQYKEGGASDCPKGFYWNGTNCVPGINPESDWFKLTDAQKRLLEKGNNLATVEDWYKQSPEQMEMFKSWIDEHDAETYLNQLDPDTDQSKRFNEALGNDRQWNQEWYTKRKTLPQFKDVAERRLAIKNQDMVSSLKDPINLSMDWWRTHPSEFSNVPEVFYAPEIGAITRKNIADYNTDPQGYVEKSYYTDPNGKLQNSTITHEESHIRDYFAPQKNTTDHIKKSEWTQPVILDPLQKIITAEEALSDPRNNGYAGTYQQQPTEFRARLNVWRKSNGIDPLKNYTEEELKSIIDKNLQDPNLDHQIKELYETIKNDPSKLKFVHDSYVSNDSNKDLDTAKHGGLHKFVGGGMADPGDVICPKDYTLNLATNKCEKNSSVCPKGYDINTKTGKCVLIVGEPGFIKNNLGEWVQDVEGKTVVEDANDERYKDYLIRKRLSDISKVSDWNMRNQLFRELSRSINEPRPDNYAGSLHEKYYNPETGYDFTNKGTEDDLEDDTNKGDYGSKVQLFNNLTANQFTNVTAEKRIKFLNDQGFPTHDKLYFADNEDYGLKNYTPDSYIGKAKLLGHWLTNNSYAYNKTTDKFVKPFTPVIEDEIDRARLKMFFPDITDEDINKSYAFATDKYASADKESTWDDSQYEINPDIPFKDFVAATKDNPSIPRYTDDGIPYFKPESINDKIYTEFEILPNYSEPIDKFILKKTLDDVYPTSMIEQADPSVELYTNPDAPEYYANYPKNKLEYDKYNWYKSKPYNSTRPGRYKRDPKSGGFDWEMSKKVQDIHKYMEGYYDEDDNYFPGEREKAEEEGRQINFQGRTSLKDRKVQKKYNQKWTQYQIDKEAIKKQNIGLLEKYGLSTEEYLKNYKKNGGISLQLTKDNIQKYVDGGYIVEEIEDGGDPDPLDPHQLFLKNWYENRVFPKEMQKAKPMLLNQLEQPFPPYVPTDVLPTNVAAAYNYDANIVELNKNYPAELQEGSKTHENNHYLTQDANEYLDKPHTNLIEQNIINPKDINTGNKEWDKAYKENFDEIVSPEEMHSRIMTLRELAGFKPDQVITEKDLEDYFKSVGDKLDPDVQDIKQVTKGNKAIVELLNYMASNNSNEDLNIAKYGGTTDYELGEEIDEATMKKLKKLGYTFETI